MKRTLNIWLDMRINSIKITNFRGFEHKEFSFDPHMTVVVGNNTAGKTTLLKAVLVALGAYLKSLKGLPSDKAYRMNFSTKDVYKRYDESKKDFFPNKEFTRIDVKAELFFTRKTGNVIDIVPEPSAWWRELRGNSTTHSNECAREIIQYARTIETARASTDVATNAIFPLVLSFGIKRIDNDYRASNKRKVRETRIEKAYKSALLETVDFKSAFDWLYRYDSNLDKGKEFAGTREALINALSTAMPSLSNIEIDSKNKEFIALVSVTGQEPEYQTFDNMSDGFKAIICIVAEIAYRCIELNGFLGEDAIKKTPGVVVIDEIDVYLHPRWQKHILSDLMNAFPMIQFIVSSHSPFIIQSLRNSNVITLDGRKCNTDPFKRSIEEIAILEMDIETPRSERFNSMVEVAEEYYQLVKQGKRNTDQAQTAKHRLDEFEEEYSEDPAYVALLRTERRSSGETD